MPDARCLKRLHDWGARGAVDGARCVRPGCGKEFGRRPSRQKQAVAPRLALVPPTASAPALPSGGASARLARSRGLLPIAASADNASGESGTPADSPEAESPKRESLSEWLTPSIPGLVVDGCKWSIKKAGRIPHEPDPVWEKRFAKSYDDALGHYVPRLEMHPAVALLVATLFLWLSMFVGAPKVPKAIEAKKDESKKGDGEKIPVSASDSNQGGQPCQTPVAVQSFAVSPPSVDGLGEFGNLFGLSNPSRLPDASGAGGPVTNAGQNA